MVEEEEKEERVEEEKEKEERVGRRHSVLLDTLMPPLLFLQSLTHQFSFRFSKILLIQKTRINLELLDVR